MNFSYIFKFEKSYIRISKRSGFSVSGFVILFLVEFVIKEWHRLVKNWTEMLMLNSLKKVWSNISKETLNVKLKIKSHSSELVFDIYSHDDVLFFHLEINSKCLFSFFVCSRMSANYKSVLLSKQLNFPLIDVAPPNCHQLRIKNLPLNRVPCV